MLEKKKKSAQLLISEFIILVENKHFCFPERQKLTTESDCQRKSFTDTKNNCKESRSVDVKDKLMS